MEKLTEKQNLVLDFLKKSIANNGFPPTVREIGKALGLRSPATVQVHLDTLADKGYIKKGDSKNRAIELLVENEYEEKEIVDVPLLGKVTAGSPIEAIEMPDEYFSLPAYLIPAKKEVFTLRVQGTSMINVGIHDGDIVIVQKEQTARNGEIVVALIDDSATVKTFYKENGHIRLQPENDTMEPIIVDECVILGKVFAIFRTI